MNGNVSASVRQRLLSLSKHQRENFQHVLGRYALERLLFRLSQSAHRDRFVLKGAMLFAIWADTPHRPTRDVDFLSFGAVDAADLEQVFREIGRVNVPDDGIVFQTDSIRGAPIREDQAYGGIRISMQATLDGARIPIQIDVGFGDAITPGPVRQDYPVLLEFSAPTLLTYPRVTVVAEKFQAMVTLGMANSRMKDFFDLWVLARNFRFNGAELASAILATFERRQTQLPDDIPLALTPEFSEDATKKTQWQAFLRKGAIDRKGIDLPIIVPLIDSLVMPPVRALLMRQPFACEWPPSGPWEETSRQRDSNP